MGTGDVGDPIPLIPSLLLLSHHTSSAEIHSDHEITGIGYRMVPRLRVSRIWPPLAMGARFTQPRDHSLANPCIVYIIG